MIPNYTNYSIHPGCAWNFGEGCAEINQAVLIRKMKIY